ncbi:MAG: C-terminal helicase domain-containing protein [Nocardioides sp.]
MTEEFTKNRDVQILLATDAAGEGLNLQAAHLMVNYDLPWNPNRIEQRFGRIHRIGQEEVCRLVEPRRLQHPRGRGLHPAVGEARTDAPDLRRQGLRRPRRSIHRDPTAHPSA